MVPPESVIVCASIGAFINRAGKYSRNYLEFSISQAIGISKGDYKREQSGRAACASSLQQFLFQRIFLVKNRKHAARIFRCHNKKCPAKIGGDFCGPKKKGG